MPDLLGGSLDDPRVLWVEDILRFGDTDANGHINNAAFSVLFESGRVHLMRTRLAAALPDGTFFVIARLAIDFRHELHYPGRVRTATWIEAIGRSSVTFGQAIRAEDRTAAQAQSVCVLLDGGTRRATPLPEAARDIAAALLRLARS